MPSKATFMNLSAQSLGLYVFLLNLPEDFNPSLKFISKNLKMSKTTAQKHMGILEKRNIIRKIEQGDLNKVNKYAFVHPKEWT